MTADVVLHVKSREPPAKRRKIHVPTDALQARSLLKTLVGQSQNIVILSGAGLDEPSGVPTYNGMGSSSPLRGKTHNLFEYTEGSSLVEPWAKCYKLRQKIQDARHVTNPAQELVAKALSAMGQIQIGWISPGDSAKSVTHITQNISGLARLQLTGSHDISHANLIELHGRIHAQRCPVKGCKHIAVDTTTRQDLTNVDDLKVSDLPVCPKKHRRGASILLPGVIGPTTKVPQPDCLDDCDLLIVVGTTGKVDPAGLFMEYVQVGKKAYKSAPVFYFNAGPPQRKGQYTYWIDGDCKETLPIALDFNSDLDKDAKEIQQCPKDVT